MVVITGATGLLGSVMADHFTSRKIPVVGMHRNSVPQNRTDIKWVEGDVTDVHELIKNFEGAQCVIHAAAMVSFAQRNKKEMFRVNVDGTTNVVNACLRAGVKRLIHISSVGALGVTIGQKMIDEKATWPGQGRYSNYGHSKYMAELEVFRGEAEGLSVAVVNPSIILDAAQPHRSTGRIFRYVYDEHRFFTDGHANYVDVRDVAEMVFRLYQNDSLKGRFIASAGAISWKVLFEKIGERFNKKPPSVKVSVAVARWIAFVEEFRSYWSGSEPLISKETARAAMQSKIYSNERASHELAMNFRHLDDTIAWCCNEYLSRARKV